MLIPFQVFLKRTIDFLFSFVGNLLSLPLIILALIISSLETRKWGIYSSTRIGQNGRPFTMWKIRTMKNIEGLDTTVTTSKDPRITPFGQFLRRTKLDELPQLWNVIKGDMSLVGPRPDVPGFADTLIGEDRILLSVRPGITGLATLAYRDEEQLLAKQKDPEQYNKEVIWPEKVRLNKYYIEHYSLWLDFKIIYKTIFGGNISV
ncbi:sugar transferase [Marixanthomonas sp. SCSIO 43207]|uniref:sugar transferase n=1 Tax=Marixanthomonas sp. SCSIO 43207 TaxID=2779360 RepID=UPI001CA86DE9|nr:sugar transferase [Marixanthomonas sp. SCSIO 43207]UAB80425.1 sugar transferase [Marixanthomonas sp. SCSIO 43207]